MNDDYKACLREHGLKSTKARNGVLGILSRETSVVTVETVYAALLEQGCKVNFSTVYRILEMFTERKLTEKIFLPDEGKYGFSLRRPGHTHRLICLQCHKVVDLAHCPLSDTMKKKWPKRHTSTSSATTWNSTATARNVRRGDSGVSS